MTKPITLTNHTNPEIVTTSQNIVNVATAIFAARVPDGVTYAVKNTNVVGGVVYNGTLIVLDLRNAANQKIRDGRLFIGYEGSSAEFTQWVRALPLSVWADLETAQQKNAQYRAGMVQQTDLNTGPGLVLTNRSKLIIGLEASEQVDWSKSYIEIPAEEGL